LLTLTAPTPVARVAGRAFLSEVQALRAVAVMLVVLYHLWPSRLTGGFVGVDVFFVISGFLITSHLHREVVSRGRIRLAAFYARRARRLLPAALVVLVVSAVGTYLFVPASRWATSAADFVASAFYVQNWQLAERAVDYSASHDAASVVQHFWSLSVEEQFYLGWPALIILLVLLGRRWAIGPLDRLLVPGIGTVTALSFGYSVYATATDPAAAYFVTPTRVWELGAGALLALWSRGAGRAAGEAPDSPGPALALALRWGGLGAILLAATTLTSASPFPGYLALLPVLGTAAVIVAGEPDRRDPLSGPIRWRPTKFLGDVSYSLYLWHWPAIVIAPFALGHDPRLADKVALLAVCLVLAWLTKVAVEAPAQGWRLLARPVPTAWMTVTAMLVVTSAAGLLWHELDRREEVARANLLAAQEDPCFGSGSLAPGSVGCGDPFGPPASLTLTADEQPWFADDACVGEKGGVPRATCRWGTEPPTRRVALVGDSHAEHWRGALHRIAEELNWEMVEILKGGCPATSAVTLTFEERPIDTPGCQEWGRQLDDAVRNGSFDYVFTSSFASAFTFETRPGETSLKAGARGFVDVWTGWADAGAEVYVIRDVPTTGGRNIPECLAAHPGSPIDCARPRAEAVPADAATLAAEQVGSPQIHLIDFTDRFCDEATCYAAIGGAVVYWDLDHITAQYSRSLAPTLLERMGGGFG
jgi:peptidoglycan/LPS O-acetylase OafA/YrhL